MSKPNENPYLAHLHESHHFNPSSLKSESIQGLGLHTKKQPAVHGNYESYYGYRTGTTIDKRLLLLEKCCFVNKKVLDIGCNSGHITLGIAKMFSPASIDGVDIDPALIFKARRLLSSARSRVKGDDLEYFPISCAIQMGALPTLNNNTNTNNNNPNLLDGVNFRVGDWLHESFALNDDERYDVILALSITKWIHLNNGDGGIRHLFRKIHDYLIDGGLLILEFQSLEGYKKRAGMNERMRDNYLEMQFMPEHFLNFLVKSVGFTLIQTLEQDHQSSGFQRPIYLMQK